MGVGNAYDCICSNVVDACLYHACVAFGFNLLAVFLFVIHMHALVLTLMQVAGIGHSL